MSGLSSMAPRVKRCPETRAHYAHEWYDPALRVQCPGGPDERTAVDYGNGARVQCQTPAFIEAGFERIAEAVAEARGEDRWRDGLLTGNTGLEDFRCETFAMRCYCWCDNTAPGHHDDCPPNFEHHASGFTARWYKYAGRGGEQGWALSPDQWQVIERECLTALAPTTPSPPPTSGAGAQSEETR